MGGAYSALPHRLTHNKKVIPVITRMSNSRSTSISVTQFRSMIGRGGGLVPTCWAWCYKLQQIALTHNAVGKSARFVPYLPIGSSHLIVNNSARRGILQLASSSFVLHKKSSVDPLFHNNESQVRSERWRNKNPKEMWMPPPLTCNPVCLGSGSIRWAEGSRVPATCRAGHHRLHLCRWWCGRGEFGSLGDTSSWLLLLRQLVSIKWQLVWITWHKWCKTQTFHASLQSINQLHTRVLESYIGIPPETN